MVPTVHKILTTHKSHDRLLCIMSYESSWLWVDGITSALWDVGIMNRRNYGTSELSRWTYGLSELCVGGLFGGLMGLVGHMDHRTFGSSLTYGSSEFSDDNSSPWRKKSLKGTKKGPFFEKKGTKKGPNFRFYLKKRDYQRRVQQ